MGNEISKALEADALASSQGVVAEKLLAATNANAARRSATDVAQRQRIFAFCADWDLQRLTDFLRWYARYHARNVPPMPLDLRNLPQQVDGLEHAVATRQTLLQQIDDELHATCKHANGEPQQDDTEEQELVRATLENRRDEIVQEMRDQQRALQTFKVHLLATIDGVDLTCAVTWPAFIKAVTQVYFLAALQTSTASHSAWHPAATGYAMVRDSHAKAELGEFTKGEILLPPPANHEIDGHTDDSASDSAGSDDNASSRSGGSGVVEDDGDGDDKKKEASLIEEDVNAEKVGQRVLDEEEYDEEDEDGDEEEGENNSKRPVADDGEAKPLTADTLADHTEQAASSESPAVAYQTAIKRPRVIKRPVPPAFDAATRSPIFFGYTLDKRVDELVEAVNEHDILTAKETTIFECKIQKRTNQLDDLLKTERGKLDALHQRETESQQKRDRYWEKRQADLDRAKRELDPNDIFFRTREVQDKKTRDNQTVEDGEVRRQKEKIQLRITTAQDDCARGLDQIRTVRAIETPVGDQRLRFHEIEMDQLHADMLHAKIALATAKEEYVALTSAKSTFKMGNPADTKHRAQLLYAEDQIRARERELEGVCTLYDNELFLLQRAQELFDREQLFLPLFQCLQNPTPRSPLSAFDATKPFTVLELAVAMAIGIGGVPLRAKIGFVFQLFRKPASDRKGSLGATIELLQRDAFAEVLRLSLLVFGKLGDLKLRQELSLEYLEGLADREFLQLDVVVDMDNAASTRNGMTAIEFESYCLAMISKSKYLCELLDTPWQFEQLSRFVLQHMSAIHQYKLGLINVNDLQFAIAEQSIHARAELSRSKKELMHERALAMGENDPLKTDYSKYLPKRRTKLLSQVVPLDHGGYRNLLHYRMEVILRATVKLQTVWRARKGRQLARLVAEKQAFYHARGVALHDARAAVEAEWIEKDSKPAHTVEKMKFEAKIRMKQVKLRTKGNAFTREQVLALLMEEAVQHAQHEVEHRFREMEEELGYLIHTDALAMPLDDVEYLKSDISKALVAQVVQAKHETDDVAAVMDAIALSEELEKKKKMVAKKAEENKTGNQEPSGGHVPEGIAEREESSEQHLDNPEMKAQRVARTQGRHDHMLVGRLPRELHTSGLTRDDHLFQMTLAFPNPPLAALQQRLQRVCVGMTDFKMAELLQELPSKRHLCGYVTSFRRHDGTYDVERLELDLLDHFRMVRGARELAEALVGVAETDLEYGLTRAVLTTVQKQSEAVLTQLVTQASSAVAERNAEATSKKLVRMGYKAPGLDRLDSASEVQGNPAAVLQQKEQHELVEKQKRLQDAHARFVDAMRLWKEAELALHATQDHQIKIQTSYPIFPTHRTKWTERLSHALRLPEATTLELQHKYTEVYDVCHNFIELSRSIACVLVRELHVPISQKSILPVTDASIDGRNDDVRSTRRLKYEAHGIRFQICTDDHGRLEHSDEYAAKYGGHEVRNSALYHRALWRQSSTGTVLLPLECVVDFQGYRVLCASNVPIEIIAWNENGTTIQKITKQLVHGSENRGKSITFQSKELDSVLAEAASQLNLSRHHVRGYHDLTAKILHAPADLLGYLTADKRFVLVHFARVMPPEDPEVTTHLGTSTRGLSILWRQLRPELVASFPTPLSSDALSAMTYGTPDWLSQATDVEDATRTLVENVIPAFARKLSQKRSYFTAQAFDLTNEMHRHGINMRHLGLLRAQFPVALSGTATLQYATGEIQTTEDFTRQVERGAPVYILGKTYSVSRQSTHRYDAQCITLDQVYMGDSIQHITVYAGRPDCLQHAQAIRDRVLVEMVARTLKNMLRHWLRTASRLAGTGLTPMMHRRIVLHCFNLLTGSAPSSEEVFWKMHLYEGIRVRFGLRAVSEVDQQNLRRNLLPQLELVVSRVTEMMGIYLRPACLQRLSNHPDCYVFVLDDVDETRPETLGRVKHNLSMLHFSMASLLLLQATVTQATSYKQLVLNDKPHGYWTLCERRGQSTAVNWGSDGKDLNGRYLAACLLEANGPIVNTDLNRAIELRKENRSYVAFPVVPHLYPTDPSTHVALEAWCKCDGHNSTRRVVLTIGRFTLSALKANVWAFSCTLQNIDIVASGSSIELHQWTHVVGTFDGTMLRLFVNGFLQNEVDIESIVDVELAKREAVVAKTRQDIADLEEDARGKCFKEIDREMQQYFNTKDGKKQIKTASQKLLDEHEFRVRLSKAAASISPTNNGGGGGGGGGGGHPTKAPAEAPSAKRDLSKVTRTDFEPLAKKQILREHYDRRVDAVVKEFSAMRQRVNEKITDELNDHRTPDTRELRIGCLSSASRRDGRYFFHGAIAHVAYYRDTILTRDHVNAHYVLGVRDRAHTSDDLFALASQRFARALAYAPDDCSMLERFAENICASLKYDLDHQHAHDMYKKKVRCGLVPFMATENAHGIAEVLKNIPREPAFSDLFVECYRALLSLQPMYFKATASTDCRLSLRELGRLPFDFFLGSRSANSLSNMGGFHQREQEDEEIPVFADVIQKVLLEYPMFYGDQLTNMGWLRRLENPRAVVYFILSMEAHDDIRSIDLNAVRDITNDDMEVLVKHNRFALSFALAHCTLLNDFAIMRLAVCCSQIETLDVSYCTQLTDAAMHVLGKHCSRLKTLCVAHCHLISDLGVDAVVQTNPRLETLGLSYCERISERCMSTIGSSCPHLHVLEMEMCVQLGNAALRLLAGSLINPTTLRTLNVAGCHRVGDDGVLAIATKCTRLRAVNLRLCDKLSDISLRVLTHNSLELEKLQLEEVGLATYKIFQFDQAHDGRGVVDKHLLHTLQELNVAGCGGMNDLALGHLGHRAKQLRAISVAGCTEITDHGLQWLLIEDMLDKSRCGEHVEQLDLSYCPQLTAGGLHSVVRQCPTLVSLNLSGCIHLMDTHLVAIIATCHKLVRLELAFCRELTDAVLLVIAKHLSLEVLNVERCVKVTDDGMREIVGQLSVLRKLTVSACKRLTDKTLVGLLEACPLLEELDATHCPLFSPEVLAQFVRRKVTVVCTKLDDFAVSDAVEKRQQLEAVKTQRSARSPGRDDSEDASSMENGDVDTGGEEVYSKAVVEAKKPTRTARLPGSTETNLPRIHQRPRDP